MWSGKSQKKAKPEKKTNGTGRIGARRERIYIWEASWKMILDLDQQFFNKWRPPQLLFISVFTRKKRTPKICEFYCCRIKRKIRNLLLGLCLSPPKIFIVKSHEPNDVEWQKNFRISEEKNFVGNQLLLRLREQLSVSQSGQNRVEKKFRKFVAQVS